jgi:hypothetical protein
VTEEPDAEHLTLKQKQENRIAEKVFGRVQKLLEEKAAPTGLKTEDLDKFVRFMESARVLAASAILAAMSGAIYEYLALMGVVDVSPARVVLVLAGFFGIMFIWETVTVLFRLSRTKKIWLLVASLLLSATFYSALNRWAMRWKANHAQESPLTARELREALEKRWEIHDTPAEPQPLVRVADKPKQPFAIEVENSALMADSREWTNGFWVAYPTSHGNTLTPAHLALFLRFVNLEGVDTHIASFKVEIKSGNQWIKLIRLPTDTVYNAYPTEAHPTFDAALKTAVLQDFSNYGLQNQIDKTDGLLRPNEMIRGWAMFEYPPTLQKVDVNAPIRVTVTDVKGMTAVHIHYRQLEEKDKNDELLRQLLKPKGMTDISGLFRRHWSDPN